MQVNKQSTLIYWDILHLHEGHWYNQSRGSVTSYQLTKMFSSKKPRWQPQGLCTLSLYTSLPNSMSNHCDITKWHHDHLLYFSVGKALCTCRGNAIICLHICWHPLQTFTTTTATHKPHHLFHVSSFEPATLSPRYFGVPSLWDLNLFSNMQAQIQGVKGKAMGCWWQN